MEMNRKRKRGRRCDVTPSPPPLMKSEKAQMAGEKEMGGKKCVCVGGGVEKEEREKECGEENQVGRFNKHVNTTLD